MKTRWLLIILLSSWTLLQAASPEGQLTTIVGEVLDSQNGSPIEGVNIYLRGTNIGTTTTPEGVFLLRTYLSKKATMVVSAVGYKRQQFSLTPGMSAGINVTLTEEAGVLSDIVVMPGHNPAIELMKQVRKHRSENDLTQPPTQRSDTRVYLSDIQAKHLRRHLWKNMGRSMIMQPDSTYLLPLYHRLQHLSQIEEHTALFTETEWQILLNEWQDAPNFYHNTVGIYSTAWLSPLATDGNTYYNYYLADSISEGGKAYRVDFRPKNTFYPTFEGEMLIDSATYALRQIRATMAKHASANYLRQLHIHQQMAPADTLHHYHLQHDTIAVLLDFAVKSDTGHIFPTLLLTTARSRADSASMVHTAASHELVPIDTALTAAINTPLFRVAGWAAQIVRTGYIPTGTMVEIGKVTELLRINPQEQVRIGLPLRTNERFSRRVCLEAYAAYGTGDNAWKGAGQVHVQLPTPRRNTLSFSYSDQYVASDVQAFSLLRRENATWFRAMTLTQQWTQALYRGEHTYNSEVRRREGKIHWESDWTDHLETQTTICYGEEGYGEPTRQYTAQPSFRYTSLATYWRLGWNERKVDLHFQRIHLYSRYPTLYVGGEVGSIWQRGQEDYHLYARLQLMLRQQVALGVMGRLDYLLEAGCLFGQVPYSRMTVFEGNQSYGFDPYHFTLMHHYQYAASRYVNLHAEWNGKGCLFNLIPGIRYLRLRELIELKMAYGTYDRQQLVTWANNAPYSTLTVPYVEIGVGLGNVLRIGDIYSVWRLTHRSDPGAPTWSMRFRLRIEP